MSEKPIPSRPGVGAVSGRLAEILRVDHAGQYVKAAAGDDGGGVCAIQIADHGDTAIADTNIDFNRHAGQNSGAAAQDQIVGFGHLEVLGK